MKYLLTLALVLLFGGCIEYNPTGLNDQDRGVFNPPTVDSPCKTDEIVQVAVPEVDVLFIIDNSCSMLDEQTALGTNFPEFMTHFIGSGLDYHIGVVTTDMINPDQSGKLIRVDAYQWIDNQTANPEWTFQQMSSLGTGGSGDERGLDAAYMALEQLGREGEYNEDFERTDATLHLVVVSDEEDHSDMSPNEFIDWLDTRKATPDMTTFSSIVGNTQCGEAGYRYLGVTAHVGGISWSICDENWSQVLEQLGLQAAGLKREYFLSSLPVEDTITVQVIEDGTTYVFENTDWFYSTIRNSITFNEFVPGPLSTVKITYKELSG